MQTGIPDLGPFPFIVAGVCVWVILCIAATAMISNLARYRGCSELYTTAGIFFTCIFLTPVFAVLLVGLTPSVREADENLEISGGNQE